MAEAKTMGPITLVDKSFLQGLDGDQLSAFHRHYSILITPILLEEILGNLVKAKYTPDQALGRVIDLATRANSLSTFSVPDVRVMCIADLLGHKIPMNGQVPAFGAKEVTAPDGSKGFLIEQSFEKKLLRNWSLGKFSEKDKEVAGNLAKEFEEYDLLGSQKEMQQLFPRNRESRSLEEVKAGVLRVAETRDTWELVETHLRYCSAKPEELTKIKERWERSGRPRFNVFAPYAFYCWMVLGIYFLGITAELIRASNKEKTLIDVIYFYYLPFSYVFISHDRFHETFFPLVARPDQNFVWSDDLKPDLEQIASFHRNLNDKDRLEFEREFGSYPPPIPGSRTRQLWEQHMRPWSPGSGNRAAGLSPEESKRQAEELFRRLGLKE
jgi:hypothetical protein